MASVTTTVSIVASSQSVVTWGRVLTDQEGALLRAKRGSMWVEGKFGSFPAFNSDGVQIFAWVNAEAATEYVAYCNTFTPPPVSATVEDIPEPTPTPIT
jgi:hypothetical protein